MHVIAARSLHLKFDDHPVIHLISCYAPIAPHHDERSTFFEVLGDYIAEVCNVGLLFVCGDFNSILQSDERHEFGTSLTTETASKTIIQAADQFTEFLEDVALVATVGQIKLTFKPFSFKRANMESNNAVLLDYILIRDTLVHLLTNLVFPPRPTPSDHWPVAATFNIRLLHPSSAVRPYPAKPQCAHLFDIDSDTRTNFVAHIKEHIGSITWQNYDQLANLFVKASDLYIEKTESTPFRRIRNRTVMCEARQRLQEDHHVSLRDLQLIFNKLTQLRCDEYMQDADDACASFSTLLSTDSHVAYRTLKSIMGGRTHRGQIAGNTAEDRKKSIVNTCSLQLNNSIGSDDILYALHTGIDASSYNTQPFTIEELTRATNTLKNNKAPGPDLMYAEYLKLAELHPILLELLNHCLETGETHQTMKTTAFAMIPKPGSDHSDPAGWRYIAMMSYISKLYDIMLRERIKQVIEPHLRFNQNGFRAHLNTQQHILALEFITNALRMQGQPAILTFIDFKNAFPSVQWAAITKALEAFQVPPKLITAILSMYKTHRGFIRTADGETDFFTIGAGVLQGDTLAPYLFIIVLNEILRKTILDASNSRVAIPTTERQNSRHYFSPICITDLNFADDIVLINNTVEAAEAMLHSIETEARKAGLCINSKKTQNVLIGKINPTVHALDGSIIQNVSKYRYLGRWTDVHYDITTRIGAARHNMFKLRRVWTSTTLTKEQKAILFKVMIITTLTYGMSTYPLTQGITDRIRGATTRMLKKALNIPSTRHCTIEELYQHGKTVIELPSITIFRQRMQLIRHALTSENTPLAKVFLLLHEWESVTPNINSTIMQHLPKNTTVVTLRSLAKKDMDWDQYTEAVVKKIYDEEIAYIKERSAASKQYVRSNEENNVAIPPPQQVNVVQHTLDRWINVRHK